MKTTIGKWLEENTSRADDMIPQALVIDAETVSRKVVQLLTTEEKAEILFEIVKPQTDKTLREITPTELKELALNFKDNL